MEKRISHGHQARAFYFIFYPVCCRVILAVGFNFLFVFQFFSLFSKPKIKNKSKTPLNSISVTTREERRRRRRCRELCSCCTHTNGKEWKRRRISTRKAAATSECPSVQPETSGPLEQHTEEEEEEEEKVMCLRHPFTRLAATRCHDNNNILLFRLTFLLLYYFAISGDLQQCNAID